MNHKPNEREEDNQVAENCCILRRDRIFFVQKGLYLSHENR
jgi:hypothetical protein